MGHRGKSGRLVLWVLLIAAASCVVQAGEPPHRHPAPDSRAIVRVPELPGPECQAFAQDPMVGNALGAVVSNALIGQLGRR